MVQSELVIGEDAPLAVDEQDDLDRYEAMFRQGFAMIGSALRAIRDDPRKLYRKYGTFEDYCPMRLGFSSERAYRLMQASGIVENLKTLTIVSVLPVNEAQIRPLTRLDHIDQPIVWQRAVETAPNGKVTAAHVEQVAQEYKPRAVPVSYPEVADIAQPAKFAPLMSSATPEWYTPQHIIKQVIQVFGQIDLDPCSNSKTAPNVPATYHFTQADDGLSDDRSWNVHGDIAPGVPRTRVYMNPPYGDVIGVWVERLIRAYEGGEIAAAIALLPARTDTAWFQPIFNYTYCFVRGRLKFSGAENSAPFPSVVVYLGDDTDLFQEYFEDIGPICIRRLRG